MFVEDLRAIVPESRHRGLSFPGLLTGELVTMIRESKVVVLLKRINDDELGVLKNLRPDQVCIDLVGTIPPGELKARILNFGAPSAEVVLQ